MIKSPPIDKNNPCYPGNILHSFAENGPVKRYYANQLKQVPGRLITIPAKDEIPKNSKMSDIWEAQIEKNQALHPYLN